MKNFILPNKSAYSDEAWSEHLNNSIEAFSEITEIPVTWFDADGQIIKEYQNSNKICKAFQIYADSDGVCRKNLYFSGHFAARLGEPYIAQCKAGLINITVALLVNGNMQGYLIAGPIVMGKLRNSSLKSFASLNASKDISMSELKALAEVVKSWQPPQFSHIALLFYNCILSALSDNPDYMSLRQKYNEQSEINTSIQNSKKEAVSMEYPHELEGALINQIKEQQVLQAKESVKKLLDAFSILEVGNMEAIRARTLWLFAAIIRVINETDELLSAAFIEADLDIINWINETESFNELVSVCKLLIESIIERSLTSIYCGHSQTISLALQFIHRNYKEKISLKDIEKTLHINPSYFSTLFKQEMGVTFTDYLNTIKINEACRLLANTSLSIIDIALATGFEDQSYFTKVFKKKKGTTPKSYRSLLSKAEPEN